MRRRLCCSGKDKNSKKNEVPFGEARTLGSENGHHLLAIKLPFDCTASLTVPLPYNFIIHLSYYQKHAAITMKKNNPILNQLT